MHEGQLVAETKQDDNVTNHLAPIALFNEIVVVGWGDGGRAHGTGNVERGGWNKTDSTCVPEGVRAGKRTLGLEKVRQGAQAEGLSPGGDRSKGGAQRGGASSPRPRSRRMACYVQVVMPALRC